MKFHLVVVRPFAGFNRGDVVADPEHMSAILQSEHAACVVRVASETGEK